MSKQDIFGLVALAILISTWIGVAIGYVAAGGDWRAEAIQHGAATWEIADEATGRVEFRWKDEAK